MITKEQILGQRAEAGQQQIVGKACKAIMRFFSNPQEISRFKIIRGKDETYDCNCEDGSLFMSQITFDTFQIHALNFEVTWNDILYHANRLLSEIATPEEYGTIMYQVKRSACNEHQLIVRIWFAREDYVNRPFIELQADESLAPYTIGCMNRGFNLDSDLHPAAW